MDSTPNPSSVEYYERRSVPLAIPSNEKKTDEYGKEYVVGVLLTKELIKSERCHSDLINSWCNMAYYSVISICLWQVFNIHLASKLTAQRRYREFDALHANVSNNVISGLFIVSGLVQLKRQFSDFLFPRLPAKWPFALSAAQVDTRRRGLEDYMEKGNVRVHTHTHTHC